MSDVYPLHWPALPTMWLPASVSLQSTYMLADGIKDWAVTVITHHLPRLSHLPTSIPPSAAPQLPGAASKH